MEKELNIANILKDKPTGTKLYADAFGELSLERVKVNEVDSIYTKSNFILRVFYSNGKFTKNGEPILVPSKKMRDWNKFAWKTGDILVSNDGKSHVIFSKWYDNDNYTNFFGKHYLNTDDIDKDFYCKTFVCDTNTYSIENKDAAKAYINDIEERLNGKLNLKTLNIEDIKTEYQFKPFEKVLVRDCRDEAWRTAFFSYINEYKRYVITSMAWKYCIPYKGNESLLGTTKNVDE